MEELLEYLARSLVDKPDEVSVEGFDEDDGTIVLELHVAEDDAGKVIGRGGRTVAALRTVMKAAAVRDGTACWSTSSIDARDRRARGQGARLRRQLLRRRRAAIRCRSAPR